MQIHAFEMNPDSFRCLEKNLAANAALAGLVRAECAGVSGHTAFERTVWYSGMDMRMEPAAGFTETVLDLVSLDYLYERRGLAPGLVKIDAEGYEAPIIAGGNRLLMEQRPVLIYELHRDSMPCPAWREPGVADGRPDGPRL